MFATRVLSISNRTEQEKASFLMIIVVMFVATVAGVFSAQFSLIPLILIVGILLVIFTLRKPYPVFLFSLSSFFFYEIAVIHLPFADLRPYQFLWIFLSLVTIIRFWRQKQLRKEMFISRPLIIFIGSQLLSMLVSKRPLVSLVEAFQFTYFGLILITTYFWVRLKNRVDHAVAVIAGSFIIFIAFGLISYQTGKVPFGYVDVDLRDGLLVRLIESGIKEQTTIAGSALTRMSSFFLGPVATANLSAQALILLFVNLHSFKGIVQKFLSWLGLAGGSMLILLTYSRAAWAALAVTLFFLFALHKKSRIRLVFFGLLLAIVLFVFRDTVIDRFGEFFDPEEGSYRSHFALYEIAVRLFIRSPVFGVGSGMYKHSVSLLPDVFTSYNMSPVDAAEPHNMILSAAAQSGILGLGMLVWLMLSGILATWRSIRKERQDSANFGYKVSLFLSFLLALIINQTLNAFSVDSFWIIFGLAYSSSFLTRTG